MSGKKVLIVVVAVLLALGLVGCKAASEEVAEKIAGDVIGGDVEVKDDEVTIETDDGAVSISGEDGALPDDFPADFPLYPQAKVSSSSRMAGGDDVSFYIGWTSADDPLDVYDWYVEKSAAAGWTITSDMKFTDAGTAGGLLSMNKDAAQAQLAVNAADAGAEISLILTMPK